MPADIKPETPIVIQNPSLLAAIQRVQALEATLGVDAKIDRVTFSVTVSMDHVDKLVEASLSRDPSAETSTGDSEPEREPKRIDRVVPITPEHLRLYNAILTTYSREVGSADGSVVLLRAAKQRKESEIHNLRMSIIKPIASRDVQGFTCVWGGSLPGAETISPLSRPKECDTVIHLTHPVSADDLKERELRPKAKRIFRYRILGLDDIAWERQNQPAGPLDLDRLERVLIERWEQRKMLQRSEHLEGSGAAGSI